MDHAKRQALQKYQALIMQDLDVVYIMDDLFARDVLSREAYDALLSSANNRVECVRLLLDYLVQSGDDAAYEGFVDSLAKPYRWLWEKLTQYGGAGCGDAGAGGREALTESAEDALWRADVPRLCTHFVNRHKLEEELETRLAALRRHQVLVLHGMAGAGKTTAAAAALRLHRDPALLRHPIYWLQLSDAFTHADMLTPLTMLYRKAWPVASTSMFSSSVSMSSLSSATDSLSHSLSHSLSLAGGGGGDPGAVAGWREARESLRTLFNEEHMKESLLVLDGVTSSAAADAFDVGCKLLVTTRDRTTFQGRDGVIVTIEAGFTEAESLEVFASCLRVHVGQLPPAARTLHSLCKGGPLQISLLGAELAENRERLLHKPARWKHYVDKLSHKKDFLSLLHMQPSSGEAPAVKLCVSAVEEELQPALRSLAVLAPGARVRCAVLATVWQLTEQQAERVLRKLTAKSLVTQQYVQEWADYEYWVHDLIASCLRSLHTPAELCRRHGELLRNYGLLDTARVAPRDIYIATHLAHHIHATGNINDEWSLFNKLYLDLEFVGALVRLAGQAAVVTVLTKYHQQICRNEPERILVEELREWLGAHGADLHRYPHTDLLQAVLLHAASGALYCRALQLARAAAAPPRRLLYFTTLQEHNKEANTYKNKEIDVGEAITAMCFLRDYILVGLQSGNIRAYDTRTCAAVAQLRSDGGAVTWLGACPVDLSQVASLDADGQLRVRILILQSDCHTSESEETDGASECDVWEGDGGWCAACGEHGALSAASWATHSALLVAHTHSAVLAYSGRQAGRVVVSHSAVPLLACALAPDDVTVLVATRAHLHLHHLHSGARLLTLPLERTPMQILTLPNDSERALLVTAEETLEVWWRGGAGNARAGGTSVAAGGLGAVRGAVSAGGAVLFLATDDARVLCLHLQSRAVILDLPSSRGQVTCMDVSEVWLDELVVQYDVLATADRDRTLRLWHLDVASLTTQHRKARLTSEFACGWSASPLSPASDSGRDSPHAVAQPRAISPARRTCSEPARMRSVTLKKASLKLDLRGLSSAHDDELALPPPLLAAIDRDNVVQVMVGRRALAGVGSAGGGVEGAVTALAVSPCARHVLLGLHSGAVRQYSLRTQELATLCDVNSPVTYLEYVSASVAVAAGRGGCLLACVRGGAGGEWTPHMLLAGHTHLGSQEMLDGIQNARVWSVRGGGGAVEPAEEGEGGGGARLARAGGGGAVIVRCWWLDGAGLLTVEQNACVKLWSARTLQLAAVLSGRRADCMVTHADMQARTLALSFHRYHFQTMRLRVDEAGEGAERRVTLVSAQECRLASRITALALSRSGRLLAAGLDNGHVVLWNVSGKRQVSLLKLHKCPVTSLLFSPEPPCEEGATSGAPLVLVSAAAELVWWNVSQILRAALRSHDLSRNSMNVLSPVQSPNERSTNSSTDTQTHAHASFQFADGPAALYATHWRGIGSGEVGARGEVLSCIKLAGSSVRRLAADPALLQLATVDSSGHAHLLRLLPPPAQAR